MKVQDAMKELKELDAVSVWLKYIELKKDIPKEDYSQIANYAPNKIIQDLISRRRVQIFNAEVTIN